MNGHSEESSKTHITPANDDQQFNASLDVMEQSLKDARMLVKITAGFMALTFVLLYCRIGQSGEPAQRGLNALEKMAAITTLVLMLWTYVKLVKGPRPVPKGFQFLIGFVWSNLAWVVFPVVLSQGSAGPFFGMLFLAWSLSLIGLNMVGSISFLGGLMGCFVPLLAIGACAVLFSFHK